jgi:mono/diheme cytochrome c family protein
MITNIKMAVLGCVTLSLGMTASAQNLTPAEEGRRLFVANNCYGCHGPAAAGAGFVGAPNLRGGEAELCDLKEALREGEDRGMPAFLNLTSTDISNLYAYFQSTGTTSEPTFFNWWQPVPTASVRPPGSHLNATAREKRLRLARR